MEIIQPYVPHTKKLREVHAVASELLETKLPENLRYHAAPHTLDPFLGVVPMANRYAVFTGLSEEEREDVITAAYFHDTGYIKEYADNEGHGAAFAREFLPRMGFRPDRVLRIGRAILETNPKVEAQSLLGRVLVDADLDNLGRSDFLEKAFMLGQELNFPGGDVDSWYKGCLGFISGHEYHTDHARNLRNPMLELNKSHLRNYLEGKRLLH